MIFLKLLLPLLSIAVAAPGPNAQEIARAKQLKAYIDRERPAFEKRNEVRRNVLEELDKINSQQNDVRQKIQNISNNHRELAMASDNLSIEVEKQKKMELIQKRRVMELLKVAHKVKRDGLLRYLVQGDSTSTVAGRFRVLFKTLRSHSALAKKLEEKALHLTENENKIAVARHESKLLLEEMREQGEILEELLKKKTKLLAKISRKQASYKVVFDEYKQMSRHLQHLFSRFESQRADVTRILPRRGSIRLPVDSGRIVKNFGRQIHEKFRTVTYEQGIEIETEHNSPVFSVLPGVIEFGGWVKGLGNVVIIHHGGGFYSLNAHLFQALKTAGSEVKAGDPIGTVGDTGDWGSPGLYFELRENGKPVDPVMYFSAEALKNLT